MNQPTVNIDELEQLARAATQGDWSVKDGFYPGVLEIHGPSFTTKIIVSATDIDFDDSLRRMQDAAFIAAANPAAILALIKLVREQVTQAIVDTVWHPDAFEVPGTGMVAIPLAIAEKLEAMADLADRRKFADAGYAMPNVGLTWGECRQVRTLLSEATFVVSGSIG